VIQRLKTTDKVVIVLVRAKTIATTLVKNLTDAGIKSAMIVKQFPKDRREGVIDKYFLGFYYIIKKLTS
jgi:hypothetical protein